jgi:hypothetical protein
MLLKLTLTEQKTSVLTTASKLASGKGSASAVPACALSVTPSLAAYACAVFKLLTPAGLSSTGSSPITVVPYL